MECLNKEEDVGCVSLILKYLKPNYLYSSTE